MSDQPHAVGNVAIIGSFRRHYHQILQDIAVITSEGWRVTTPLGRPVIDETSEFVRFTSDISTWSDDEIEQAAMEKILAADWVYARLPRGYIGRTACYEVGRILEAKRPLYVSALPRDLPVKIPDSHIGPASRFARQFLTAAPESFLV